MRGGGAEEGRNLANLGLRARWPGKEEMAVDDEEKCRPWRRRLAMAISWSSLFRAAILSLLVAAITTACLTLPVEKVVDF